MSAEKVVWDANVSLHDLEAQVYESIHPEIFNRVEQRRLRLNLRRASALVKTNSKIALDFGCGSGNVTSKLLELGWKVVAVDSSEAMLQTLRKKFPEAISSGRLVTHLLKDKHIDQPDEQFDMITAYSVLHHIYDYEYALREMARLLKTGGVLYIDHEHNDTYWTLLSQHLFKFYDLSNRVAHRIQTVPFRSRIAKLDYRSSDYRCKESARIEWARVNRMLCDYGFTTIATNYLSHGSSLTTPLNQLIRMARPEAKDMISLVCVKSGPSRIINQRRKSSEHN